MKDLKIRVANEAESKEAQELFFELGAKWRSQINREEAAYVINTEYPSIILHGGDMSLNWNTIEQFNSLSYCKEITLQELRDMVNQEQDEPFLTPETTLNDQYAEIEKVRQSAIEATPAERQAQYGCFEDVAFVTENIMATLSKVRSNGLTDLPHTHRMALYMIASKMARIVNGDFNSIDGWHDISGYATLVERLIDGRSDV